MNEINCVFSDGMTPECVAPSTTPICGNSRFHCENVCRGMCNNYAICTYVIINSFSGMSSFSGGAIAGVVLAIIIILGLVVCYIASVCYIYSIKVS